MSIHDRAARAANAERESRREYDPEDPRAVPDDEQWRQYETEAGVRLAAITGEDPGPAQRLEPYSWRMRQLGQQYPDAVQRRRLLVWYVEGDSVEILAARGARRSDGSRPIDFFVVHRSINPNEEAVLSNFHDTASLGRALGS